MVKSNADLKVPEILRSVCTDFLNLHPEIMGYVPYDPVIEAAINSMKDPSLGCTKEQGCRSFGPPRPKNHQGVHAAPLRQSAPGEGAS